MKLRSLIVVLLALWTPLQAAEVIEVQEGEASYYADALQ